MTERPHEAGIVITWASPVRGQLGHESFEKALGNGAAGGELRFQLVHQGHQLIHLGHDPAAWGEGVKR